LSSVFEFYAAALSSSLLSDRHPEAVKGSAYSQ